MNTRNFNRYFTNPEEIPNYLDENIKKLTCYEMGITLYRLGHMIININPEKSNEYANKAMRYCKGRYYRYEPLILYIQALNYRQLGNIKKYNEILKLLKKTLKVISQNEKYRDLLISESFEE